MLHVFGTTFTYTLAPKFVRYAADLLVGKWGTNLDTEAPDAARLRGFQLMVKFGIPGTPL